MSESCEESLSVQYSPHEKNSLNQSPIDVSSESIFQAIRPKHDIQLVKFDSAENNLRYHPVNLDRVSADRFYTMKNSNNNNSKQSITALNNQLLIIDENNQSSQARTRPPPVQNHKIRSRSVDNAKHLQQNTVNLMTAIPITIGSSSGFYTGDLSSIVPRSKSKKTSIDQATRLRKAILLEHKQKKERIETESKNDIDQVQEQHDHQILENKKIANQISRYRYTSDGLLHENNNISYQSSLEKRNQILQQEIERLCNDFEKTHDIKPYDLEKFNSPADQQGPSTFNVKSSDLSPDQSYNGQQSFNSTTKSRHSSSKKSNHTIQPPNLFSINKNEHRKSKIEQYVIEIPSDLPHKAEYLSAIGDPDRMLDAHRDANQFIRPKSNIGESSHGLSTEDVLKIKEFVNKNKLNSPSSSLINNRGPLVSSKGSSPRKKREETISDKKTIKPNIECVSDTDSDREEHCKGLHIVEWIPDSGGKGVNGFYMGNEKVQNNLHYFGSSSTDGSDNQIYPLEVVIGLADQGKMSDVSDKESTTFVRQLKVMNNKEKDMLEKMMITRQQKQDQQTQISNQNQQVSNTNSSKVTGRTSKCSNNTSGNSSGTSSNIKPSSSSSTRGTYGSNKTTHREISEKTLVR